MSTLNLSGKIACFSSMQKRSDFLDKLGLVFIVELENWQHLHAFWIQNRAFSDSGHAHLFQLQRTILRNSGFRWQQIHWRLRASQERFRKFLYKAKKKKPCCQHWDYESINQPTSPDNLILAAYSVTHLSFACSSALAKINTMRFSGTGQLIGWNLVLRAGRMPSGEMYESHMGSSITANASSCMCRKPQIWLSWLLSLLQSDGNGVPNRKWWELLEEGTIWKSGSGREVLDIKASQNDLGLHQLFCCGRRMTPLWGHVRVLAERFIILWKRSWSWCCFAMVVGFIPFSADDWTRGNGFTHQTGSLKGQRDTSPQKENSVFNYSPSSHSKAVRPSFIFRTQIKIFLMKPGSFLTLHRQQRKYHVQDSESSKDILKIIHVIIFLDYFNDVLTTFMGLECVSCVSESSQFSS